MAWSTNLPIDLVLVRHGESEGNIYDKMDAGGKREKLARKHTSAYRLTDLGRRQAKRAGAILQEKIGTFDKMYCSEFVRAIETAGHMNLPESRFQTDILIREITSGSNRGTPHPLAEHGKTLKQLHSAGWWVPKGGIGGESFADLSLRLRSFLDHLQETANGMRVLVVCHAHVIRALTALLEDKKATDFQELIDWKIPNCHIRWYTRRVGDGDIRLRPFKVIELDMEEPSSESREDGKCIRNEKTIQRPLLSAAELLQRASAVEQVLNSDDLKKEMSSRSDSEDLLATSRLEVSSAKASMETATLVFHNHDNDSTSRIIHCPGDMVSSVGVASKLAGEDGNAAEKESTRQLLNLKLADLAAVSTSGSLDEFESGHKDCASETSSSDGCEEPLSPPTHVKRF
jgi:broad specificity phosphatase PhoE